MVSCGTISAASKVLMGARSVVMALSGVLAVATALSVALAGHLRYVQLKNSYLHSELFLYHGVDVDLDCGSGSEMLLWSAVALRDTWVVATEICL